MKDTPGILEGKVAVITGGSRGLGLAIAQAYLREGAAVVIGSRSAAAVEAALAALQAGGARAVGQTCDVGVPAQVEALADRAQQAFGALDIWVNNAALTGPYGPAVEIAPEVFRTAVQTNILGVYYGSMVALRRFLPQRHGKLINILGRGDREPGPYQIPYAASKAWVRNFTLALAAEHRGSGVEILGFNPGLMETDLLLRSEVVSGYEAQLAPLATVIRMWAVPPEVAARRAVELAGPATDGRSGLIVRGSTPGRLVRGALQEGLRRLFRRPAPSVALTPQSIPSAWPERPK